MTDLYEEKADSYDSEAWEKVVSRVAQSIIVSKIVFDDQMHVMDFGAGTGMLSSHIVPMVKKITAVDISEAMLERLTAKPELKNKVDVRCQDIMTNPIDERFDLVMSAFAMHHVEDIKRLMQCFADHLKSGAKIALIDVDKEDGSFHGADNEGVFHCGFDRDTLKAILQMYSFNSIDFVTADHFEWEGKKFSAFLVTAIKE